VHRWVSLRLLGHKSLDNSLHLIVETALDAEDILCKGHARNVEIRLALAVIIGFRLQLLSQVGILVTVLKVLGVGAGWFIVICVVLGDLADDV
jgi:hypothetical protein